MRSEKLVKKNVRNSCIETVSLIINSLMEIKNKYLYLYYSSKTLKNYLLKKIKLINFNRSSCFFHNFFMNTKLFAFFEYI